MYFRWSGEYYYLTIIYSTLQGGSLTMAQPKETLKAIFLGKKMGSADQVKSLIDDLNDIQCTKLIDIIMASEKEAAVNLEGEDGGFLTGLRKIVESVEKDQALELPEKPRGMNQSIKEDFINKFDKGVRESNDEFADGLRMILKSKSHIRTSKLSSWKYELSDPDFPLVLSQNIEENNSEYDAAANDIKEQLNGNQSELKEIMKKHKDDI